MGAKAGFGGFGLGLLVSQGFIGAKAPLDPLCRFFVAQSFAFYDCLPGERQTEESYMIPEHRALGAKACHPDRAVGEWRDLVLAFGKARQTLLFAK